MPLLDVCSWTLNKNHFFNTSEVMRWNFTNIRYGNKITLNFTILHLKCINFVSYMYMYALRPFHMDILTGLNGINPACFLSDGLEGCWLGVKEDQNRIKCQCT